jgi:hypothetical protein
VNPKQITPELLDPLLQIPDRRTFTVHLHEFAEHSSDEQPLTLSMMRKAGIFANGGDGSGLTAEFPWDPGAFSAV